MIAGALIFTCRWKENVKISISSLLLFGSATISLIYCSCCGCIKPGVSVDKKKIYFIKTFRLLTFFFHFEIFVALHGRCNTLPFPLLDVIEKFKRINSHHQLTLFPPVSFELIERKKFLIKNSVRVRERKKR